MKLFKRSVWSMLSLFFVIMFLIMSIGHSYALEYDAALNNALGIYPYEKVDLGDSTENTNYYKSDYYFADGSFDHKSMRQHSMEVAQKSAAEGTVILWNKNNALPLAKESKLSLFGIGTLDYIYSAMGSGHVADITPTNLKDALEGKGYSVNSKLWQAYFMNRGAYGGIALGGNADPNYLEYKVREVPWAQLDSTSLKNVTSSIVNYNDAAIMTISRFGSENGDTYFTTNECLDNTYLDLSKEEAEVLTKLGELKQEGKIKKVILLLNSPTPMQMKNITKMDIDACLWVGVGGSAAHEATADVLSGDVNPSGHTVDTFAYANHSAPATVNFGDFVFTEHNGLPAQAQYSYNTQYVVYQEGIYVGYRYYETRYEDAVLGNGNATSQKGAKESKNGWNYKEEVAMPFGYGESYTTFEYSNYKVTKQGKNYKVTMTVTNTGAVAGKDAVQLYLQKPYTEYDKATGIEKSAVELVGFEKTGLIEAGKSETVTIFVDEYEFKSYDSYGAKTYILEKGNYYLAAGHNAHDALNNILAKKGKTTADGMDYNGDAAFVEKINYTKDDFETYSFAPTGEKVTNQFDNADLNLYENTADQKVTYLSRKDWDATYPTPVQLKCVNEKMIADMQYVSPIVEDPNAVMPTTYGTITSEFGQLSLIQLFDLDYDAPMWEDLLNQLTWEEMNILATYGAGAIAGVESINMPISGAKDGPCGISITNQEAGGMMAFPSNVVLACTWNQELVEEVSDAFGMEIMHVGYTMIYGPGANIHRSAFSGRNWEYLSEDGFISGKMFASQTIGLKNRGIITCAKHFALNDQEKNRCGMSTWANEQTIREIYLKAFEAGITEGKANGIMSSLNRLGTTWAGKHKGLLTNVLRNEWGFIGIVETDAAVGVHMTLDGVKAEGIIAGNDLWMGGSNPNQWNAWKDNATVCQALRTSAHRILYTVLHSVTMNGVSSTTKIIYNRPWWDIALETGTMVSGAIMGLCLAMTVTSFIFAGVKSNKRKK